MSSLIFCLPFSSSLSAPSHFLHNVMCFLLHCNPLDSPGASYMCIGADTSTETWVAFQGYSREGNRLTRPTALSCQLRLSYGWTLLGTVNPQIPNFW